MRTRTIVVLGLLCVAMIGALLLLRRPLPPSPALPQPNGYDTLLRAAQSLIGESPHLEAADKESLKAFVAQNAEALKTARVGLQAECRVPLVYSMEYATNHMAELSHWKRLTRAFLAEGKLAEIEARYSDAATSYLDTIRLGHECCRGGVLIDMLVGVASQSAGGKALQGLMDQLNATDCRRVARQLEQIISREESGKEVLDREQDWSRRSFGWRSRVAGWLARRTLEQNYQRGLGKLTAQQTATRRLTLDFASRAYELEHGQPPKDVSDLVPTYLNAPLEN